MGDVLKAFRTQYPKYRTPEQLSDDRLKTYFRAYVRPRTGQKGRQGFFKGVALTEKTSAFGDDVQKMQWKRQEEARRQQEVLAARRDAEDAIRMASSSSSSSSSVTTDSKLLPSPSAEESKAFGITNASADDLKDW